MHDVLPTLLEWNAAGKPFAVARVVSTWGSAPRRPGSTLLVTSDLEVVGSVSGGCIEGEVMEVGRRLLDTGGREILEYGVDNETAWSAGLSCGGRVRVVVEPWAAIAGSFEAGALERTLASGRPFALVTPLEESASGHEIFFADSDESNDGLSTPTANGGAAPGLNDDGPAPGLNDDGSTPLPVDAVREAFEARSTGEIASGERRYFVHVFAPTPRLVIVGGSDIAVSLVALAGTLGFDTIVLDPRGVFVRPERFSTPPGRLLEAWPQDALPGLPLDADTFAVLLTHDPKIDDPALHLLLDRPVAYIGALGGKRTQEKRRERLAGAGFDGRQIERIHGPVGIDIDAATPAEIALSIMAEIVAVRNRSTAS